MNYGMLLCPHANARYHQAMKPLAKAELQLLLGAAGLKCETEYRHLGGVDWLCFESSELSNETIRILRNHSHLYLFSSIESDQRFTPLFAAAEAYLGADLTGILKYKGKTNEVFTHMLSNFALYSGAYFANPAREIHFLDPLCGRGTALFDAVNRGWSATGADMDNADIAEAYNFFKRYLEYHRLKHTAKDDSLTLQGKKPTPRRTFTFAQSAEAYKAGETISLSLMRGDTVDATGALPKNNVHVISADLPYGVQHAPGSQGKMASFEGLLGRALIVWQKKLKPGGAIALSFNSYTLKKSTLLTMLSDAGYEPLTGGPYDELEHWVEQAVLRDAVVARKKG